MKKLDFLYFDAGGGHRAAAQALSQVIEKQGRQLEVRLINLQEQLDSLDIFRKLTGLRLQDIYNALLKKGWTLGSPQLIVGMHVVIRMFHGRTVRALESLWKQSQPDLLVSLVPNFNRAICDSLRNALPGVPLVTILTDIADYSPHFWIERQKQYFICGSQRAVDQARSMAPDPSMIFRASGMILNPRFYEMPTLSDDDRREARRQLGFNPDLPVGLVLFGGQGAAVMSDIARDLTGWQLLLICGHNDKLRARLQAMPRKAATFVEGFTRDVPRYMQLVDYFIGKPGPGSLSEAVAMRLPVIVERNAWTLPQERYNAEWVREQGIGLVLKNFRGISHAVEELLTPVNFAKFREATSRLENRAVFEIPDMLERILSERKAP